MNEMISTVRNFCQILESFGMERPDLMLEILVELFYQSQHLSKQTISDSIESIDIPEIFTELKKIPDNLFFYQVFDPYDKNSVCSISLKDALEDIYCDLKNGLIFLEQNPYAKNFVFKEWQFGFQFHWGRHLIDTIRFLMLCKL